MSLDRTNVRTEISEPGIPVEDLVRRAQSGDASASETIFAEHWGICLRVARRMTGSDADAEDVVQEAYVKAIMNLQRFDHRCAFRTWLLRIVTNAATDQIRRRRRKTMLLDFSSWFSGGTFDNAEPSKSEDPSLPMQNAELRVRLDQALGELSQTTRGAFVLYAEAGMTYQEVSEALEIPLGTVMSRIHSARKKLRSIIEPLDDETPAGGRRPAPVVSEPLGTNDPIRHILPNTGNGPFSHNLTW